MTRIITDADSLTIVNEVDVENNLSANKELYNDQDKGWSKTREFRRVAHIPNILVEKWLIEDGVNVMLPENKKWLRRKLNSSEYLYLRTAPGELKRGSY